MEDDLSLVNGLSFAFKKRGASGSDGGGIQAFVPFYAESKRGAVQGADLGKAVGLRRQLYRQRFPYRLYAQAENEG